MKNYIVQLNELYNVQGGTLTIMAGDMPFDIYNEQWKRPAVIVVPGGGYAMVSKREGEPVAFSFLAKGFQVFVLDYMIAPQARYPEQLLELACSVDYLKKNADALGINKDEIFVVGFSAGGHLAANLSTDYTQAVEAYGAPLDCQVTAAGLSYPVISKKKGHLGSYQNLLNGYTDEEHEQLLKKLNLNEIVCERTAPAFIWATATDQAVPPSNALRYAMALDDQSISYELHIYPIGAHGLSTGDAEVNPYGDHLRKVSKWIDDCASFFRLFTKESF